MSSPEKAPVSSEQTAAASDHPVTNIQISGHVTSQSATYPTQKQMRKQVTFITNDSQPSLDVPGKQPSSLSTTDTNTSSASLSKANAQYVHMQSILSAVEQPSHVAAVAADVSTSKLGVTGSCRGPTDAVGSDSGGATRRSQSQGSGNASSSSSSGGSGTSNSTSSRRTSIPRSKSAPCWPPLLIESDMPMYDNFGSNRSRAYMRSTSGAAGGGGGMSRIRLGVCAMARKAHSRPMREILGRITSCNEFELVVFDEKVILNEPVDQWPVVDCLMSWYSEGFPLRKAQEYVELVRPFCVNDLVAQEGLLDRRRVYRMLQDNSIPVPRHIVVSRDGVAPGDSPPGFVEADEYVELDGERIYKPFVEKPASGEDHNIWVYYPASMGGGVKRLFRKVANRSGNYDPAHCGAVRRDGSYIYEEFLATGGTDVKVYTVGPRYAHAEARKSPVVDGRVARTADGKEVRFPVLLSPQEKEIARMVCLAFGQKVCGFDLLRSERGGSYVCDVNGWSFVKSSAKFYGDAADILRSIILQALAPHRLHQVPALPPAPTFGLMRESQQALAAAEAAAEAAAVAGGVAGAVIGTDGLLRQETYRTLGVVGTDMSAPTSPGGVPGALGAGWGLPGEELRCVLAVIRHGDRTPKQKVKVVVQHPTFLELYERHADASKKPGMGRQAKLKSAAQLQELLDVTRSLLQQQPAPTSPQNPTPLSASSSTLSSASSTTASSSHPAPTHPTAACCDEGDTDLAAETRAALAVVRSVLEAGGHFSGVNRKAQLKPRSWQETGSHMHHHHHYQQGQQGQGQQGQGHQQQHQQHQQQAQHVQQSQGVVSSAQHSHQQPQQLPHPHPNAKPVSHLTSASSCTSSLPSPTPGRPGSLLLIVKWGGVLTHAGRAQAETLGVRFRTSMYPRAGPAGGGLLRLHSTYRHDFKVYSSDEGRVQTSAAAFTQGLLCLEGTSLTPILASLVNKDAAMLEAFGKGASYDMRAAKEELYKQLTWDPVAQVSRCKLPPPPPPPAMSPAPTPPPSPGLRPPPPPAASTTTAAAAAAAAASSHLRKSPSLPQPPQQPQQQNQQTSPELRRPSSMPSQCGGGAKAAGGREGGCGDGKSGPCRTTVVPGLPPAPLELLEEIRRQLGALVAALEGPAAAHQAVEVYARTAHAAAGSGGGCGGVSGSYDDKAAGRKIISSGLYHYYSSLSMSPDEWLQDPGSPCGGERWLLLYDRWHKLYDSFYSPKKGLYDISKIPDIYDAAKHALIHNAYLPINIHSPSPLLSTVLDPMTPASPSMAASLPAATAADDVADAPAELVVAASAAAAAPLLAAAAATATAAAIAAAASGATTEQPSSGNTAQPPMTPSPPSSHNDSCCTTTTSYNNGPTATVRRLEEVFAAPPAAPFESIAAAPAALAASTAEPSGPSAQQGSAAATSPPPPLPEVLGELMAPLYLTARTLADVVVPNEYGIAAQSKLVIGSAICRELLGKLLADMGAMREESLATEGSAPPSTAGSLGGSSEPHGILTTTSSMVTTTTTATPTTTPTTSITTIFKRPPISTKVTNKPTGGKHSECSTAELQTESADSSCGGYETVETSYGVLPKHDSGIDRSFASVSNSTYGSAAVERPASSPYTGGVSGVVRGVNDRVGLRRQVASESALEPLGREVRSVAADCTSGSMYGGGGCSNSGSGNLATSSAHSAGAVLDSMVSEFGNASLEDERLRNAVCVLEVAAATPPSVGSAAPLAARTAAVGTAAAPLCARWQDLQGAADEVDAKRRAVAEGLTPAEVDSWELPRSPAADTATEAAAVGQDVRMYDIRKGGVEEKAADGVVGREEGQEDDEGEGGDGEGEGGEGGDDVDGDGDGVVGVEEEAQALHRLCPQYATDINSPLRHVRTRVYYTSESHIHALLNVLRYCHLRTTSTSTSAFTSTSTSVSTNLTAAPACGSLLGPMGHDLLETALEYDYMTQIVFRMFENKLAPVGSPERFRVEVSFSPGASRAALQARAESLMARTAQRRQQADAAAATVTAVAVDNEEAPAHHAGMGMPGAAHSIEYDVGSGSGGGDAAVHHGDSSDVCGFDVLSRRYDADGTGCGGDAVGDFGYLDALERDRHALPLEPLTCLNAGVGAAQTLQQIEMLLGPLAAPRKTPRDIYALQVALKVPAVRQLAATRAPSAVLRGPPPPPPPLLPMLGAVATAVAEEAVAAAALGGDGAVIGMSTAAAGLDLRTAGSVPTLPSRVLGPPAASTAAAAKECGGDGDVTMMLVDEDSESREDVLGPASDAAAEKVWAQSPPV